MRWLMFMCLLKCDHSFLLRLSNFNGNKHKICIIANAFKTLKYIPTIESITVGKSTIKNDQKVFVNALVVCKDGEETIIQSSGDSLLRACEYCVSDTFIEVNSLSQIKDI